jgi:hypothetical protein
MFFKTCAPIFLVMLLASQAVAGEPAAVLCKGAWAMTTLPDPFKKGVPLVSYLPAGTIIFSWSKAEPIPNATGYLEVLTHYGHPVIIESAEPHPYACTHKAPDSVLRTAANLIGSLPTNKVVFHENILCLSSSDRLVEPHEPCRRAERPRKTAPRIGKGWIYQLSDADIPGWKQLDASLDPSTVKEIKALGLDPLAADFRLPEAELNDLESRGYLTRLDREHPRFVYEYNVRIPLYVECGQETIDRSKIEGSIKGSVISGIKSSLLQFVGATLGFEVEVSAEASKEREWTIKTDTSEASYLLYSATQTETDTGERTAIYIEKRFECEAKGTRPRPGDEILEVAFEVKDMKGLEPYQFAFDNPSNVFSTSEKTRKAFKRPVFVSINAPDHHQEALRNVMKAEGVSDVALAHFIVANMNNTCPEARREFCLAAIGGMGGEEN